MQKIDKNNVSLAGEFAVLSQLALRGYIANMTLGHTKGIDILVAEPKAAGRMLKLEVKTNYHSSRSGGGTSTIFGKFLSAWMMGEKHEIITDPDLFYCFVTINQSTNIFRFFIVPSKVVAEYVKKEHQIWIDGDSKRKNNIMRTFRMGVAGEKYRLPTPIDKKYEDNWDFK